jgi:4-hydroxybenzoate polyprenyltransferase
MRLLHFILSHSIFVACCAVSLCAQTNILLHLSHEVNLYGFVFFSTLCSYNFYWLLSKFYFSSRKFNYDFVRKNFSFFGVFLLAGILSFYFALQLMAILPFIAIGIFLTLLYSLPLWPIYFLRKWLQVGFLKTILLSITWAYVTIFLPAFSNESYVHLPISAIVLLFATRLFFMLLLCSVFDTRDIAVDKINGLHSLATDVSKKRLSIILLLIYFAYLFSALIFCYAYSDAKQAIAFIFVGILLGIIYTFSTQKRGYFFYYFLVDGLMLLSGIFTYLANKK